jgi:hypothetical protein
VRLRNYPKLVKVDPIKTNGVNIPHVLSCDVELRAQLFGFIHVKSKILVVLTKYQSLN